MLRRLICWLLHGGEHDYVEDFSGQAHVQVLRCKKCDHHSVGWG